MPNAGGSATMYGVLYQILGTVHWAAEIRLRAASTGSDLGDAQLHIEPLGGGGDLRIEGGLCRIVEQWKARSDGGTWSLAELIDEVLPDLYRAVDASALDSSAIYRFVTEGRRGRWGDAQEFFESLRVRSIPAQPLLELGDSEPLHKVGDSQLTNRGLFHLIAQRLNDGTESIEQSYRRLWHLLSQFEMTESLPELLVEFDEERAIPVLCEVAVDARSSLVCWSIGRALRTATKKKLVDSHIAGLLLSTNSNERQTGAELAGWQSSDQFSEKLEELALNDLDHEVRTAAEKAVFRRLQYEEAMELLAAANTAVGLERWSLLESFLELADPLLVQDRDDPFWLGDCMKNCSAGQRLHIQEHLKQRIKDVKKQADDLDKSNESEF